MRSWMSPAGRSGWSQTSARAVRKWPVSRSIVAVSNSSVAKVASPDRVPSASSVRKTETSTFDTFELTGTGRMVRPGISHGSEDPPSTLKPTCTSGLRLRSRSGVRSSTRRSKGRSWWA
ncbi:hypothetical protein ASE09_23655 [Streptomyces sp. Root66D1]|nr:hypothetical protein ASE09_23655 [Streptomyces sp. Root66D1]